MPCGSWGCWTGIGPKAARGPSWEGRVWILLDSGQDTTGHRPDTDQPQSENSALKSAKDETIATLRDLLEAERQAHSEARRLPMAALERIPPAIEPPRAPPEVTETVDSEAEPEQAGLDPLPQALRRQHSAPLVAAHLRRVSRPYFWMIRG
jgi:hypothetical protein